MTARDPSAARRRRGPRPDGARAVRGRWNGDKAPGTPPRAARPRRSGPGPPTPAAGWTSRMSSRALSGGPQGAHATKDLRKDGAGRTTEGNVEARGQLGWLGVHFDAERTSVESGERDPRRRPHHARRSDRERHVAFPRFVHGRCEDVVRKHLSEEDDGRTEEAPAAATRWNLGRRK